ncbi:EutN/CcmL family microcompartment protein [Pelagibaculum spongiae]|uniref:Ethanolamine utilization protein EutN n=1 Tax=Pelagibaculum spongiae TaxID=2080658 RepID=A0A2V1GSR8_9GAMM|nr:EutN/CcmL family microcompartment protein [Pelagibaculum spongiae]PVZ67763.1 ethanolamine utilization protein EutN [Pelagibaculum spongiae]
MLIGKVTGNVWATRKHDGLRGQKLMVVEIIEHGKDVSSSSMVCADIIGAGIGETVLIARGGAARKALLPNEAPIDACIIGIIDDVEVQ